MSDHPIDTSPLRDALRRAAAAGGRLADELTALGEYGLADPRDAEALAGAIRAWAGDLPAPGPDRVVPLHLFTGLLQGVETREAFDLLRAGALPPLLSAFDAALVAEPVEGAETLLFVLKVAGMYRVEGTAERVAAAARRPLAPTSHLWPIVFGTFDADHPYRMRLLNALRGPIPEGLIGLTYLDLAGRLAGTNALTHHPFDNAEGRERLGDWLRSADPAPAVVAAANLPYLSAEERAGLLDLARAHPGPEVRLHAAWADARLGDERGLRELAGLCLDPGQSRAAANFLTTLGHGGLIPAAALAPEFQAKAVLCAWLAHPNEFGQPPDTIELVDSRAANWPPTGDHRRLWLFRFEGETGGSRRRWLGMVGSITFSLREETAGLTSADDVYALHCGWELEAEGDPRAPRPRTVEAGRAILRGFGWDV